MATERPFRLNPATVRAQLSKLHETLSQADAQRLEALLPLFESSGDVRARLADCLQTLYEQTQPADPQAEFRAFRNRLGKAAGVNLTGCAGTRNPNLSLNRIGLCGAR